MTTCDYCDETFADEDALLAHLADAHDRDTLSAVDQRKVEQAFGSDDTNTNYAAGIAVGVLTLVVVGVVAYVLTAGSASPSSSEGATTPSDVGSVHYHGTLAVVVDGDRIDFSQSKYQVQDRAFHFERGNGERWHAHATGVTLAYGLESLGFTVTDDGALTVDGTTYTNTTYLVNGKPVDPSTYVFQQGDHIRVVATT